MAHGFLLDWGAVGGGGGLRGFEASQPQDFKGFRPTIAALIIRIGSGVYYTIILLLLRTPPPKKKNKKKKLLLF